MAECLPPPVQRKRPLEDPKVLGDSPPFDFHEKKVVGYLWKIHHEKMVKCDTQNPNIYSPCHLNIPFILEMYPRGFSGDTFAIFVYLRWRLEEEAVVNVRLVFYGSEGVVLWSETMTKEKVSKDVPLLLPMGPTFWDVHKLESEYLVDGYLWIKCTVWKYDGPPELASIDDRYQALEINARTRMDHRLQVVG